jgi:thiol-disulfide isomerase/thioredoxin
MCNKLFRKKLLLRYTLLLGYLLLMMLIPQYSAASEHPILYLFWGAGCPHCEEEKEFLKFLYKQYPELEMRWFEIWDHPEFAKLADIMREAYGEKMTLVPMTFIGDRVIIGFGSYEDTGVQIQEQVKACFEQGCRDPFDKFESLPIVKKIKEETVKKRPEGWELFPASPRKQEESEK